MNKTDGRRSARSTIFLRATRLTTRKHHLKDDYVLARVAERLR
jgi:hypothetical protein